MSKVLPSFLSRGLGSLFVFLVIYLVSKESSIDESSFFIVFFNVIVVCCSIAVFSFPIKILNFFSGRTYKNLSINRLVSVYAFLVIFSIFSSFLGYIYVLNAFNEILEKKALFFLIFLWVFFNSQVVVFSEALKANYKFWCFFVFSLISNFSLLCLFFLSSSKEIFELYDKILVLYLILNSIAFLFFLILSSNLVLFRKLDFFLIFKMVFRIFYHGWFLWFVSLMTFLFYIFDQMFANFALGSANGSQYILGAKLAQTFGIIPSIIISYIMPILSRKNTDLQAMQKALSKNNFFCLVLMLPVFILLEFYAKEILDFYYSGNDTEYSVYTFRVLLIPVLFNIITGPKGYFLMVFGRHKELFLLYSTAFLMAIFLGKVVAAAYYPFLFLIITFFVFMSEAAILKKFFGLNSFGFRYK